MRLSILIIIFSFLIGFYLGDFFEIRSEQSDDLSIIAEDFLEVLKSSAFWTVIGALLGYFLSEFSSKKSKKQDLYDELLDLFLELRGYVDNFSANSYRQYLWKPSLKDAAIGLDSKLESIKFRSESLGISSEMSKYFKKYDDLRPSFPDKNNSRNEKLPNLLNNLANDIYQDRSEVGYKLLS